MDHPSSIDGLFYTVNYSCHTTLNPNSALDRNNRYNETLARQNPIICIIKINNKIIRIFRQ
jgi:hypothetical protein